MPSYLFWGDENLSNEPHRDCIPILFHTPIYHDSDYLPSLFSKLSINPHALTHDSMSYKCVLRIHGIELSSVHRWYACTVLTPLLNLFILHLYSTLVSYQNSICYYFCGFSSLFCNSMQAKMCTSIIYSETSASRNYFYVGGSYVNTSSGHILINQTYVERLIAFNSCKPYPLVFIHGQAQTGTVRPCPLLSPVPHWPYAIELAKQALLRSLMGNILPQPRIHCLLNWWNRESQKLMESKREYDVECSLLSRVYFTTLHSDTRLQSLARSSSSHLMARPKPNSLQIISQLINK